MLRAIGSPVGNLIDAMVTKAAMGWLDLLQFARIFI